MRILHVIDHLGLGGAQAALAGIVNHWPSNDDQIHILGLGHQAEMKERIHCPDSVTIEVLGGGRWNPLVLQDVRARLRSGPFDVVHAHLTKSIAGVLWAGGNRHAVCCVHLHGDPRRDSCLLAASVRRWPGRVDRFICCSNYLADVAARRFGVARSEMTTLHNAVSMTDAPQPAAGTRLRQRFRLGDDSLVVGFVGRFAKEKGLGDLLQAVEIARRRIPQLHLVLVGDGPQRNALKKQSQRLGLDGCVHFAGYSTDVAAWIRDFDIGVLPSLHEGLPLVLLEMQAQGLPVIATNVGGIPEAVQHEQTGLLVSPANPHSLAEELVRLASDQSLRKRLEAGGKSHVQQFFLIQQQTKRLRSLYDEMVSDRREHCTSNSRASSA